MGAVENWVDLLDPTAAELEAHVPASVHALAVEQLLAPARNEDVPRPKLEAHGDSIFGVFLVAVAVPAGDLVYYQEVDVVPRRRLSSPCARRRSKVVPRTTRRKRARRVDSTIRSAWSRIV